MAGFADLVLTASASEGGRLANVNLDGTEGRTWKWTFDDINDAAGDPIDLTSATCVAGIITDIDGTPLISVGGTPALTFTGGVGTFTLSATSSDTAGLAVGATKTKARPCLWYCKITSGSNVVQFWGPTGSNFRIYPE